MLNSAMIRNYFLITLRTLYREKFYALINIVGLAFAVACCIILLMYVRSELTYDQHHVNHKNIYRAGVYSTIGSETKDHTLTPQSLGPFMLQDYPDIGEYVRFGYNPRTVVRYKDREIYWEGLYHADTNVFDVFSHTALYGDLKNALIDPYSIAISKSFSNMFFGDGNPIGETLSTDDGDFEVSAVFDDLPDNTHLKYNALFSANFLKKKGTLYDKPQLRRSFWFEAYTYFRVKPNIDKDHLQKLIDDMYKKNLSNYGDTLGISNKYYLQELAEIHFGQGGIRDQPTGNIFYVYGFIVVAIFVLLVACINYTNLATARATKRAKEIGMRKVIGAERRQLIFQFLGESIVYSMVALVFGLVIVELAEAYTPLNSLMGKTTLLNITQEPEVLSWIIIGTIFVSLLAGSYPALYLSSISPLSAITAIKQSRGSGLTVRQFLVLLQLFVSVFVLACTLVMQEQLNYVSSKPLGFDKENKIAVNLKGIETYRKTSIIKNELIKNANVLGVSLAFRIPGEDVPAIVHQIETNEGHLEKASLRETIVDNLFLKQMGIEILEGRDFSQRLLTDIGMSSVVNESLVRAMGWDAPIGKRIRLPSGVETRVIGVMKDFHFESLHKAVAPLLIRPTFKEEYGRSFIEAEFLKSRWLIISLADTNVHQTINYIDSVISKADPKHPFEFKFIDDILNEHYKQDVNLMKLTSIFSAVCIFISCMGLFGLTAFTTEQRTKEIGVRKVLGASTFQIITMLSKNLVYMVLVAAILASVLSYLVMDDSLSVFAYRADIEIWIFLLASFIVAVVAFVTVALQSGKTARSNPVDSLRYE